MSGSVDGQQPFPIPLHMYPFAQAPQVLTPPTPRPKRRQVKNACTHCQKACKKCDDARPCLRCVKYGVGEECVDSQRKARKKGIKRGPYKKRDGRGRAARGLTTHPILHPAIQAPYQPLAFAPAFYPPLPVPRPADPLPPYPYYLPQHPTVPDPDSAQPFYPIFHAPFPTQPVYPHFTPVAKMR